MTTARNLLRYCLRRMMWQPLTCPGCARRLDWGASWRSTPDLVMQRHVLEHHLVAAMAEGLAAARNPKLTALLAELTDAAGATGSAG